MKIFWRIFMRQISLTDYFCKGLKPCLYSYSSLPFEWIQKGRLKTKNPVSDDLSSFQYAYFSIFKPKCR
ncbi:hypothetical protein CYK00_01715 [Neisseria sicca]|uniref:Uncharacterized protein n=1 Tax=Neisseria sicca TaxID=490 RepID=A0A2I1XFE9_NEISI|nr:hypothetical protein CYK00_01715 [Neisseria sicca]